jgi:hypothetical protein
MIDIAIVIFKYLRMILSGAFGIYGLLVKFKDDKDRITKAGRTALVLIIASALVAAHGCWP